VPVMPAFDREWVRDAGGTFHLEILTTSRKPNLDGGRREQND
jgi:hypothetical protein